MSSDDKPGRKLLVVEDDPGLQSQLQWCFDGYEVLIAEDRASALSVVRREHPPVVTLDLGLPPDPANATEGLATLGEILAIAPSTKVIVVTGNDEREVALQAISGGAYDFYEKPIDPDILGLIIDRAYRLHQLEEENRQLAGSARHSPLDGIVAVSKEMTGVCRMIEKVAPTDASILLLGESGTGKEVLAQAVHRLSQRAKARIVAINCAAIPENLLESELFGYERGAFTGATKQTAGKIEYAAGGTLFLDEVGDLSQPLQAKLLRFLQERKLERLGGRQEIEVDVRVICATHQDLQAKIASGEFREDLFYRISEITVTIPPLRERGSDALVLAKSLMHKHDTQKGKRLKGFTEAALKAIESHAWPGNVRELENRVKRACIMSEDSLITVEDLDLPGGDDGALVPSLRQARQDAEREAVARALALTDNAVAQAADLLGITRPTMYALLSKYGFK